jgi:hypothetical protein
MRHFLELNAPSQVASSYRRRYFAEDTDLLVDARHARERRARRDPFRFDLRPRRDGI